MSFTPSPEENTLVSRLFSKFDPQQLGILTGDVAVKAFASSKLPATTLGEIWSIADKENNGFLTRKGVAIALRLIGHAQKGETVTEVLVDKPGPLAKIEGFPKLPGGSSIPGSPSQRPTSPAFSSLPPLSSQDKAKFTRLFTGCGPVNGLLNGDKAREVFLKSKLPYEKLSQIWNLADVHSRGALDQSDFTIAMYLIQACMAGQVKTLPATLPASVYEQAGALPPKGIINHATGNGIAASPTFESTFRVGTPVAVQITGQSQTVRPQFTGQTVTSPPNTFPAPLPSRSPINTGSILGAAAFSVPLAWDVTPEEKMNSDKLFDGLDTQKRNYIEGDVAVAFLLQSKLSEDILAQVWDLADLNNDGKLTRDGFAVAMHLIQGKLVGKDIPSTLPESLIPPSLRGRKPTLPLPPPVAPETNLLWDDPPPTSTVDANPQSPNHPFSLQPQSTGQIVQHSTGLSVPRVSSPPSVPLTSPFGGRIASPFTGNRDLLGDDDEATLNSSALHDTSAEIGNLQNQLSSTNKSLEKTRSERQDTERALANQAGQLSSLQTQLSSAKAAYETESHLLSTLRERFAEQSAEIQKTKEELIRAESDLSAVKEEKAEVGGSLLRDKDEVRALQKKMKEVGDEMEQTKMELEKAKKEAKQQKGLLAIAKKQLSSREAEHAKILKELSETKVDLESTVDEKESTDVTINSIENDINALRSTAAPVSGIPAAATPDIAAAQPLPLSPEATSTVTSPFGKSNNPFERLVQSTSVSSTPFENLEQHISAASHADDPFGFSEQESVLNSNLQSTNGTSDTIFSDHLTLSPHESGLTTEAVKEASEVQEPAIAIDNAVRSKEINDSSFSPEEAASHFPAIESSKQVTEAVDEKETGLETSLREIEHDSDSDSENGIQEAIVNTEGTRDLEFAVLNPTLPTSLPKPEETTATGISQTSGAQIGIFDDSFNVVGTSLSVETPATQAETLAIGRAPSPYKADDNSVSKENGAAPLNSLENPLNQEGNVQFESSGLSAFDEALGKLPKQQSQTHNDLFTSFEDNFDFSSTKSSEIVTPTVGFPPPPSNTQDISVASNGAVSPANGFTPSSNGHILTSIPEAADTLPASGTTSFDNVFASNSPTNAKSSVHGISFEDAFGSDNGATKALAFDDAFRIENGKQTPSYAPPNSLPPSFTPFPISPAQTGNSIAINERRSSSPTPRQVSPPPRVASPKLRPSSKDGPSQEKQGTRHSKLSIRLPFGRHKDKKKSKQDTLNVSSGQVPVSEPFLTDSSFPASPLNDPTISPSAGDDVEAVKVLTGMGFTRGQAVTALELFDYDVQKALNSLLGTA